MVRYLKRTCKATVGWWLVLLLCPISIVWSQMVDTTEAVHEEDHIRLDYRGADLNSVLRAMAVSHGLNIVPLQDVQGTVTVSLQDVTWEEAFDIVLKINGYTYIRKGNMIYVTPGPGLDGVDISTEVIPLRYLNAFDASALLEKTLSAQGDIRVNESSNSLVVTDFPAYIQKLKNVLEDIDIFPTQVLIEAKLVDITETDKSNFGVSYTFDFTSPANVVNFDGSQSLAGPSSTLTGGQFKVSSFTTDTFVGTMTVDSLIQNNQAHLLASPSILTMSGKEARIIIGQRFPYKEKTQTTTGTTETTKFVDIGTTLRVTPLVSSDGWIMMSVHPEVSSLTASLDAGPQVSTREADVTIMVRNGETVVMGGLIKRQEDAIRGGIPFLRDIPVVGALFSQGSGDSTSTELVVFITPHILDTQKKFAGKSDPHKDEARVDIAHAGVRVQVVRLWNEAQELEAGRGTVSRHKDERARLQAAIDRYRHIAIHFPYHDKSDDALYAWGHIAYRYFKDYERSYNVFSRIVEAYPDSPFAVKAKKMSARAKKKMYSSSQDHGGLSDHTPRFPLVNTQEKDMEQLQRYLDQELLGMTE